MKAIKGLGSASREVPFTRIKVIIKNLMGGRYETLPRKIFAI